MNLFFLILSIVCLPFLYFAAMSSFHSPYWSWCSGWKWWSQAMASFRVREVWSSWTTAPAWTGCSCGVVCSGTATCGWRRSASRLSWRVFLASVSLHKNLPCLFFPPWGTRFVYSRILINCWKLFTLTWHQNQFVMRICSRLGNAGGVLHLY